MNLESENALLILLARMELKNHLFFGVYSKVSKEISQTFDN
jgi:hypothetical protein